MIIDEALEIRKPAPDSHYRLRPCENCGGDNVAYVKYNHPDGYVWRVRCFDCGKTAGPSEPAPLHDVQLIWNRRANAT